MTATQPRVHEPTEVAPTLDGPTPKVLGFTDQGALWANLGVILLGFAGAFTVLQPPNVPQLSIAAAIAATVVGTVLGSVMVGLSAIPGARNRGAGHGGVAWAVRRAPVLSADPVEHPAARRVGDVRADRDHARRAGRCSTAGRNGSTY